MLERIAEEGCRTSSISFTSPCSVTPYSRSTSSLDFVLISRTISRPSAPALDAKAKGMHSIARAKASIARRSLPGSFKLADLTPCAILACIEPAPTTTWGFVSQADIDRMASCKQRMVSSDAMSEVPLTDIVTSFANGHASIVMMSST